MPKVKKFLYIGLLPLVLSACQNVTGTGYTLSEDERVNHPIHVTPQVTESVMYSDGHGHVKGNSANIQRFVTEYTRKGHGPIDIIGSSPDIEAAGRVLIHNGIKPSEIHPVIVDNSGNRVDLSYRIYKAESSRCGLFRTDRESILPNFYNNTDSEFGCTMQHNFAAMIQDPMDLVQKRDSYQPSSTSLLTGRLGDYETYTAPPAPAKQSASGG